MRTKVLAVDVDSEVKLRKIFTEATCIFDHPHKPGSYRPIADLSDIPGDMICGSCLPQERAAALNKDIIHHDLSGDDRPDESM